MPQVKKKSPCNNCPWRKDAPREHWDKSHFDAIWSNCQDDGMSLMLCHKTKKDGPSIPCAGAILVVGFNSIGLRIAAMSGRVNVDDYSAGKLKLFGSFEEMMKANKIPIRRRNRFTL